MREILFALKEEWGIGLCSRIMLSFVIAILIIALFTIVYMHGGFLLVVALFVAMVYWLLNFILKEREECYGNNKKRW